MSIEILRPNTNGDETNIAGQTPAGGEHWDKVADEIPDEAGTYVTTSSEEYERDLYNIVNSSINSGPINYIKVYARCISAPPTQASLKIVIKSGTGIGAPDTISEGGEETLTPDWANYSNQWNTNPATGNPWTWDEINNLQVGISLREPKPGTYNSSCTQVYVEVNYTFAPAVWDFFTWG